jgi:hypothetical protein
MKVIASQSLRFYIKDGTPVVLKPSLEAQNLDDSFKGNGHFQAAVKSGWIRIVNARTGEPEAAPTLEHLTDEQILAEAHRRSLILISPEAAAQLVDPMLKSSGIDGDGGDWTRFGDGTAYPDAKADTAPLDPKSPSTADIAAAKAKAAAKAAGK